MGCQRPDSGSLDIAAPVPLDVFGSTSRQGDGKVIEYLNRVLKNELTAVNQYFLHARMFKNWGFCKLDQHEYQESLDEMRHADKLISRILFLDGPPNLQDLGRLRIGENAVEVLRADLVLEHEALPELGSAIRHC